MKDRRFDLAAFSCVTYSFQVHSLEFVIYDDIHRFVPLNHPRVRLKIVDGRD